MHFKDINFSSSNVEGRSKQFKLNNFLEMIIAD